MLLVLAGCQHQQHEPEVTTAPPPVVRHDTEALAATFPALGVPVSASWIVWDNSAEATKLHLEWIDAVVRVTPETMDTLVLQHDSSPTERRPAVQKALESELPPGPFRSGVELNMEFGAQGRSTRVFLDPQHDTVVLQSSLAS